mmetsp:Transcript_127/g.173  ORF Transcript_127/g.173 Transcript_127/m.173 type:complete len:311 (-) Transcript_127:13-945(-)
MVEGGRVGGAGVSGHDATGVGEEGGGIDGDSNTTVRLDGGGDGIGVLSALRGSRKAGILSVSPGGGGGGSSGEVRDRGGAGSSGAGAASVRVVLLGGEATGVEDVLEGGAGHTSGASVISISNIAGDNLLRGELNEVVSGLSPGRLDRLSGGESPAGSALHLVLDIGHKVVVGELVLSAGGVEAALREAVDCLEVGEVASGVVSTKVLLLELRALHVREPGDAVDGILSLALKLSVELVELEEVLGEDTETALVLLLSLVDLSMLVHEVLELPAVRFDSVTLPELLVGVLGRSSGDNDGGEYSSGGELHF